MDLTPKELLPPIELPKRSTGDPEKLSNRANRRWWTSASESQRAFFILGQKSSDELEKLTERARDLGRQYGLRLQELDVSENLKDDRTLSSIEEEIEQLKKSSDEVLAAHITEAAKIQELKSEPPSLQGDWYFRINDAFESGKQEIKDLMESISEGYTE